ncbi:hypothetical protein CLAFUW4_04117 [Fulvia fulva]|uniref:Uncharacterized protein n=1 Tax=Passalora fulva TaxID=5499 RepID=A0A9Q8LEN0_PASFU|nr:uncharacterized protein CLAFUR5_04079 [Fulvia fulva]KAK4626121.1 hypothetical protein CLAFUR4_04103 [Fulvia fulva]KAK4628043.1 hypothetical protein CLAFUR0_04104 [Fulvia fulva]UJO16008.1 hypothetical protein CLAFUR5_04079 [Fulvia fulva]WPV13983.1 hypothetical protein CLAFUW4_04117 [Fulvia fulva]WPV28705.1 hypothetical protein CLAFUW7_04106 [Fulvia fulva]
MASPFLQRLPAELRNTIYDLVFEPEPQSFAPQGIISTCRQLRGETQVYQWPRNFHINVHPCDGKQAISALEALLANVPLADLNKVRSIVIDQQICSSCKHRDLSRYAWWRKIGRSLQVQGFTSGERLRIVKTERA